MNTLWTQRLRPPQIHALKTNPKVVQLGGGPLEAMRWEGGTHKGTSAFIIKGAPPGSRPCGL